LIVIYIAAAILGGCDPASVPSTAEDAAPPPADGAATDATLARQQPVEDDAYSDADVDRGELLSLACRACHTLGAGQKDMLGPNLHGVFGRLAASREGFAYSEALRNSGILWTPEALDAWLAQPSEFIPGNAMAFSGFRAAEDRRDLIAYLLRETQRPGE
jgi:cytochrome c